MSLSPKFPMNLCDLFPKDAKSLMDEVAKDPSLDLFFRRCPTIPREERNARLLKARRERANWGYKK